MRLVDRARRLADCVVVSAFVNPLQFGPGDDYERYPRDPEGDRDLAGRRGVDCLFTPRREAMYPHPPAIRFAPGELTTHLCGPRRPGHFEGVLLVVAKLLHVVEPDIAVFGRKDAQQAVLIGRMVSDLAFPVTVDVAPIVREADGLALSSRNRYLDPEERRVATLLSRALDAAHQAFGSGETSVAALIAGVWEVVDHQPRIAMEYVEAVHPRTLQPVEVAGPDTLLALAARVGPARLIDNIVLGQGLAADERVTGESG